MIPLIYLEHLVSSYTTCALQAWTHFKLKMLKNVISENMSFKVLECSDFRVFNSYLPISNLKCFTHCFSKQKPTRLG